jgi:hypothetical protein
MPPHFFHITDGKKTHADPSGADLLDERWAEAFAKMLAENLLDDAKYGAYFVDVPKQSSATTGGVHRVVGRHRGGWWPR